MLTLHTYVCIYGHANTETYTTHMHRKINEWMDGWMERGEIHKEGILRKLKNWLSI